MLCEPGAVPPTFTALPDFSISTKLFTPTKPMITNTGTPFTRGADPAELARIEFCVAIAQSLIQYESAVPVGNRQAVGLGVIVKVIRRYQAAGTRHVVDQSRRVAGYVFAHVAGDGASVGVIAATGSLADDEADGFVLVKVLGESGIVVRRQRAKPERDAEK